MNAVPVLLLAVLLLAGCAGPGYGGAEPNAPNDDGLILKHADVPGYGHCTFVYHTTAGALATVGCKPFESEGGGVA